MKDMNFMHEPQMQIWNYCFHNDNAYSNYYQLVKFYTSLVEVSGQGLISLLKKQSRHQFNALHNAEPV